MAVGWRLEPVAAQHAVISSVCNLFLLIKPQPESSLSVEMSEFCRARYRH